MATTVATPKIKQELLALTKKDLSISNMSVLFGSTTSKSNGKFIINPPKFDIKMKLTLESDEYINKKKVTTTIGIFLFNKLMIENLINDIIPDGYYNEIINKKTFNALLDIISTNLMEGKLPIQPNLINWLKAYEFYGMKACTIFSASYTRNLLESNSKVQKEKNRILKEKGNNMSVNEMSEIQDMLVAKAHDELKNDPGMSLFDSGARGSFDNDYKNMNLMLGPVAKPGQDGKFDMVTSNYIEGLKKEDLVAAGNTVVNAVYPKAIGTQNAGYKTKQFYAGYQAITIDEDGTDCGTKRCLDVMLTPDNLKDYLYQNIMTDDGRIIPITNDSFKTYKNKKVKIRTPMFCTADKPCSICSGRRFYIMDIKNVGLTSGRISNTLLNKSMKNFHISKIKLDKVDINDLLL